MAETYARRCDACGNGMNDGYVVDGGAEHYCSKECLNSEYTDKEWDELYDNGNGDSYYTAWEDPSEMCYEVVNGILVEMD